MLTSSSSVGSFLNLLHAPLNRGMVWWFLSHFLVIPTPLWIEAEIWVRLSRRDPALRMLRLSLVPVRKAHSRARGHAKCSGAPPLIACLRPPVSAEPPAPYMELGFKSEVIQGEGCGSPGASWPSMVRPCLWLDSHGLLFFGVLENPT